MISARRFPFFSSEWINFSAWNNELGYALSVHGYFLNYYLVLNHNAFMSDATLPFKTDVKTLETTRLLLRIDTEEDYVQAFNTGPDEWLKNHFGIRSDADLAAQKAKVTGGLTTYRTSLLFFYLIEKESNIVVGSIAFHNWYPVHRRSEIGYEMKAEEYKDKGFMKDALPVMLGYGFDKMNLNRMKHSFILKSRRHWIPAGRVIEGTLFCQWYYGRFYRVWIASGIVFPDSLRTVCCRLSGTGGHLPECCRCYCVRCLFKN
jgi:ribosomal-protein-alanine N-acetyltransferase